MSRNYLIYSLIMALSFVSFCSHAERKAFNSSDSSHYFLELSKKKWSWMIERKMDSLRNLLSDNFESIQSEIRMDKSGYIDLIENTNIRYKDVILLESSAHIDGDICILSNKSKFIPEKDSLIPQVKNITEIYKRSADSWHLKHLQIYPSN